MFTLFAFQGTDLQRRTDAALLERMRTCCPVYQDVSHVLVCFPNQGHLGPYDKTTVEIRFSPIRKRYFEVVLRKTQMLLFFSPSKCKGCVLK